jgi:HNH endonuclease
MSGKAKDRTGQKFGRLTFIRLTSERTKRGMIWELLCDCGNTHFSTTESITRTEKSTQSCGCLHREVVNNTIDDFYARIGKKEPEECWEWQGDINGGGYGQFSLGGKRVIAHRFVWELINGPIPEGMFICHKCDNPPCCNPNHLFLGTPKDNSQDRDHKGRGAKGEKSGVSVLTEEQVLAIREEYARGGATYLGLGKKYGVRDGTIKKIIERINWKHI